MLRLRFSDRNFAGALAAFCRETAVPASIATAVTDILTDVRKEGDAAVARYAAKFDGAVLRPRDFAVRPAELKAAARRLPPRSARPWRRRRPRSRPSIVGTSPAIGQAGIRMGPGWGRNLIRSGGWGSTFPAARSPWFQPC